jgi:hypothetical protein
MLPNPPPPSSELPRVRIGANAGWKRAADDLPHVGGDAAAAFQARGVGVMRPRNRQGRPLIESLCATARLTPTVLVDPCRSLKTRSNDNDPASAGLPLITPRIGSKPIPTGNDIPTATGARHGPWISGTGRPSSGA